MSLSSWTNQDYQRLIEESKLRELQYSVDRNDMAATVYHALLKSFTPEMARELASQSTTYYRDMIESEKRFQSIISSVYLVKEAP